MSEIENEILARAAAAQAAHTMAWRKQRLADMGRLQPEAAFWGDICTACNDEMADCVCALRALRSAAAVDQAPANDGILRGNADLVCEAASYRAEVA